MDGMNADEDVIELEGEKELYSDFEFNGFSGRG